jgi:hypothetical protein
MGYYRTVFGVYKNNYWRHSYMENYDYIGEIYHQKAYKKATDDELKARIVFALSKTEQARFYDGAHHIKYSWEDDPLITNRKYFKELMKYEQTDYFKEVQTY